VAVLALAFVFEGVRGIQQAHRDNASNLQFFEQIKPSGVDAVADAIDAETAPGERVLAFRPIYLFLSDAEPVLGFENDEAPVAAQIGDISGTDAEDLKLITNERLEALIRNHGVRLIVGPGDSRFVWGSAGRPWEAIVREAGYEPLESPDGVTFWIRPEDAPVG
jgi:hypothetical protein